MGKKTRPSRHDRATKHGTSQAVPSDPLQKIKCSKHCDRARMLKLNQNRLQAQHQIHHLPEGHNIGCVKCMRAKDGFDDSGHRETKTKKKSATLGGQTWACLECGSFFCGGTGFHPHGRHGHVTEHYKETQHRWFANLNQELVYCRECSQEVPLKIFSYQPSDASVGSEPNTNPHDQKEVDAAGDSDDGLDKKMVTPDMKLLEAEGKRSNSPSSHHPEDISKQTIPNSPSEEEAIPSSPSSPHSEEEAIPSSQSSPHSKQAIPMCNVIRGLPNAGNSCFFNAMLQLLLALDSLRSLMMEPTVCTGPIGALLKKLYDETSCSNNEQGLLEQCKLFEAVCSRWPQFNSREMEDAEELFQLLVEGLEEEDKSCQLSTDASKKVTLVGSIFKGEEHSFISSTECLHSSNKRQKTVAFRLPIPDKELPAVASESNIAPVSVEDCFALYTEEEEDSIPRWFCELCTKANTNPETKPVLESGGGIENDNQETTKVHRAAKKRLLITRAPDVLVVTLMRQKLAPNCDGYVKVEGHVRFREMLDIQPYMDRRFRKTENNTYRLVGVAQHHGDRNEGHYIVYVRANRMSSQEHESNDKSWFYASDKTIREASLQEVLGCDAYVLLYERSSTHDAQSAGNVMSENSENSALVDIDLLLRYPVSDEIPPPMDELDQWDEQRHAHQDKRREHQASKKNATLLPMFWEFLDKFTLSGDKTPYYRFQLWGMLVRGCGSMELYILYAHLTRWSKDLAMGICNGNERLRAQFRKIARKYMLELVTSLKIELTECAKNLIQQLDLKFLDMPKNHEKVEGCFGTRLLKKMDVYGHKEEDDIVIPYPDKCALVQGLAQYVVSQHIDGYSWEGDFHISDMDVYDGKVVITKSPRLFKIRPQISSAMIRAMEKDFESIATEVLKKFIDSSHYVPTTARKKTMCLT